MFVVLIYLLLFRICCGFNVIFRFKVYNCDYYCQGWWSNVFVMFFCLSFCEQQYNSR